MSFKAAAWAIECEQVETVYERVVLIILADCHNADTGRCDPSLDFICKRACATKNTILKALEGLEEKGLVSRKRRNSGKFKTSNQYQLNIGKPIPADVQEMNHVVQEVDLGSAGDAPTVVQEMHLNQEYINQEVKPSYIAPSKFCPPDYFPDETTLRMLRVPDGVCLEHELEKFKAWEYKNPKTDWGKAFHSWVLNAKPDHQKPNSSTSLKNLNARIEEKYS